MANNSGNEPTVIKPMQQQDSPGWQYNSSATEQTSQPQTQQATQLQQPEDTSAITWTASEFVEHEKSVAWYIQFLGATIVVLGVIFFVTRDVISVVVLSLVAVVFLVVAGRKPRVLSYAVSTWGVTVGSRTYPYSKFKSFAVIDEGAIRSIMLLPLQRFMPSISLYYDPKDEQRIVVALSDALPIEERQQDNVDKFMRRIRF